MRLAVIALLDAEPAPIYVAPAHLPQGPRCRVNSRCVPFTHEAAHRLLCCRYAHRRCRNRRAARRRQAGPKRAHHQPKPKRARGHGPGARIVHIPERHVQLRFPRAVRREPCRRGLVWPLRASVHAPRRRVQLLLRGVLCGTGRVCAAHARPPRSTGLGFGTMELDELLVEVGQAPVGDALRAAPRDHDHTASSHLQPQHQRLLLLLHTGVHPVHKLHGVALTQICRPLDHFVT
eukprot:1774726-Prymnesium_polylepis.2